MGTRKDYLLREAGLVLAQAKGLLLYDLIFRRAVIQARWVQPDPIVTPGELDKASLSMRYVGDDVYSFTLDRTEIEGQPLYTCEDVFSQWRIEATESFEAKTLTVSAMARRCGTSRATIYRILRNQDPGYSYMFTMRGRIPTVLWEGENIARAYSKIASEVKTYELLERHHASV